MGLNQLQWDDLREQDFVVIDYSARKLAVYPNTSGQVMVASEVDGVLTCLDVEPEEVAALIAALQRALPKAREDAARMSAEYQTHGALEKARTGQ